MDPKEFEARIKDLDARLDKLKAAYEMYFQGMERVPPERQREALERQLRQLQREQPRATHLRFKFQTVYQRYVTLGNYWRRVLRQIEEGTYFRDIQRMRRKQKRAEQAQKPRDAAQASKNEYELNLDDVEDLSSLLDDPELNAAVARLETRGSGDAPTTPKAEPRVPAQAAPTPGSAKKAFGRPKVKERHRVKSAGGAPPPARPPRLTPDDARMRKIYDDYVSARRRNNERTDNLKYEKVQKSIEKMLPKLRQKHQGKQIDFKVVVKDGRVGLKPVTSEPKG